MLLSKYIIVSSLIDLDSKPGDIRGGPGILIISILFQFVLFLIDEVLKRFGEGTVAPRGHFLDCVEERRGEKSMGYTGCK